MFYVIQHNLFNEKNFDKLINCMERFCLPYKIVKVIPFVYELHEVEIKEEKIFCYGGTTLCKISNKYNWKPGVFLNENHDYQIYSRYYKDELLNYGCRVLNFGQEFNWNEEFYFIRPTGDNKVFDGQVFDRKEWEEHKDRNLNNGYTTTLTVDTPIQVCSCKQIYREIRTWIVKGKVVTASQYKVAGRVRSEECFDDNILEYAQKMADIYQPSDGFVLDIADTDEGLKIIEINCLNAAGFYDCNIQKLVESIEYNF